MKKKILVTLGVWMFGMVLGGIFPVNSLSEVPSIFPNANYIENKNLGAVSVDLTEEMAQKLEVIAIVAPYDNNGPRYGEGISLEKAGQKVQCTGVVGTGVKYVYVTDENGAENAIWKNN